MSEKVISEGPGWEVKRIGPEEFTDFPGSFAEWIAVTLTREDKE